MRNYKTNLLITILVLFSLGIVATESKANDVDSTSAAAKSSTKDRKLLIEEKLSQLKTAYEADLITEQEYYELKKQLLTNFINEVAEHKTVGAKKELQGDNNQCNTAATKGIKELEGIWFVSLGQKNFKNNMHAVTYPELSSFGGMNGCTWFISFNKKTGLEITEIYIPISVPSGGMTFGDLLFEDGMDIPRRRILPLKEFKYEDNRLQVVFTEKRAKYLDNGHVDFSWKFDVYFSNSGYGSGSWNAKKIDKMNELLNLPTVLNGSGKIVMQKANSKQEERILQMFEN